MNVLLLIITIALTPKQIPPLVWYYNIGIHRQLLFYIPPDEELYRPLPSIEYDSNCEPYDKTVTNGNTGEVTIEHVEPYFNSNEQPLAFARCRLII